MKSVKLIAILSISILLISSCGQQLQTPSNEANNIQTDTKTDSSVPSPVQNVSPDSAAKNVIEITSNGFNPIALTINVGDTVEFLNTDTAPHWPASAMHPTHTVYPGSDIQKCGTSEQIGIFDACKGLTQNETFSFVFKEKGTWKYHDHLDAKKFGTIIVK